MDVELRGLGGKTEIDLLFFIKQALCCSTLAISSFAHTYTNHTYNTPRVKYKETTITCYFS